MNHNDFVFMLLNSRILTPRVSLSISLQDVSQSADSAANHHFPPKSELSPPLVNVEFDDGDSGRIPLDEIRMLPADSARGSVGGTNSHGEKDKDRSTTKNISNGGESVMSSTALKRKRRCSELDDEDGEDEDYDEDEVDDDVDDDHPPPLPNLPDQIHDNHHDHHNHHREKESLKLTVGSSGKSSSSSSSFKSAKDSSNGESRKSSLTESPEKTTKHRHNHAHHRNGEDDHHKRKPGEILATNNIKKSSSSSSVDKREKSEASSGSERHKDRKSVGGSHKTKESLVKEDKSKWAHRPPPLKISAETKGSGQMPAVETGKFVVVPLDM